MGGKTTDSVTSKTDYLINNDNLSNSTKNKKAKELGVKIITEQQFLDWINKSIKPE
jgi:DNA ligase (NAD+)